MSAPRAAFRTRLAGRCHVRRQVVLPALLALLALLVTTSSAPGAEAVDPAADRAEARRILAERRFRELDPPRPLRRPLRWAGAQLRSAGRALADLVPGGPVVRAVLAVLVVSALVGFLVVPYLRRRSARLERQGRGAARRDGADPAELERQAEAAEAGGDLDHALRLRFRAGLLRLALGRRVAREATLPSGELSRRLGSRQFDDLARTFDEVVYGGRPARPEDVSQARDGWPRVLEEAGRR